MGKIRSFLTKPLLLTITTNIIGSFQFGYSLGTPSNTQNVVEDFMNETLYEREGSYPSETRVTDLWAAIVAIYYFGGGVGALAINWVAQTMSRRRAFFYNCILGVVASGLLFACRRSEKWELLLVGRLLIGIHVGLNSGIIAIYLSEISPKEIRGAICSSNPMAIVVALPVAQVLGFPDILGTKDLWDIIFGLSAVFSLVTLFFLPFSVESPRYLMINLKDEQAARKALQKLRQDDDVDDEINEFREEMKTTVESVPILQLFKYPPYRRTTILAMVAQMTIHLSGVNGVLFFSNNLFQEALDVSKKNAAYLTSGIGVIGIITNAIVTPLTEKIGRRKLHLFGLIGLVLCTAMTTVCLALRDEVDGFDFGAIAFLLSYMIFYVSAPAVVAWILIGEIFTQNVKPMASALAILANWLCGFGVTYAFPTMARGLKDFLFVPFCVYLVLCTIYIYFAQPETKGETIQDITAMFEKPGDIAKRPQDFKFSCSDGKEEMEDGVALSSYL